MRDEMNRRDWDNRKLAHATGLTDASISRFFSDEAGEKTVSKIAKALGLYDPGKALLDKESREWHEVGLAIRERDARKFKAMLLYLKKWVEYEEQTQHIYDLAGMSMDPDDDASPAEPAALPTALPARGRQPKNRQP